MELVAAIPDALSAIPTQGVALALAQRLGDNELSGSVTMSSAAR
ncbi:MAG: hypothetical protein ACYDDU_03475 [Dermatophilaceae bacterium]